MARKKRDFTEILLVVLTIVVLLAVFAVVLALVYPQAASEIVIDSSRSFDAGSQGPGAFFKHISKRASEGYSVRVAPTFKYIADVFASLFSGREDKKEKKHKPARGPAFTDRKCLRGCHEHEKLFERRAFSGLYVDHTLHDAADVRCPECHLEIEHEPKPKRVTMTACIKCHKKVGATQACGGCHTPGSILDDSPQAAAGGGRSSGGEFDDAKIQEFLQGATSRSRSLVPPDFGAPKHEWLQNEGDIPCRSCHPVPLFCNSCHLVFHNKIPDWLQVHGPRIFRQEYVIPACWSCHDANWCSGNCHINLGPTRSKPYQRVPLVPLDDT